MMEKQQFPGWLPIQVANHYRFPIDEWNGQGQSIAIISMGGKLDRNELRKDFNSLRVPFPKLKIIDVKKANISEQQNKGSTQETHLDLEVIASICPKARINIYRGPDDFSVGFPAAVNAAIDDDNAVISISWGDTEVEAHKTSELEKAFRRAKKENITVCVATGDGGSSNNRDGIHAIPAEDGLAHVQYPAVSPNVLACGGTQIMLDERGYHEAVWNNSASPLNSSATGGGVSEIFSRPAWQSAHGVKTVSVNSRFQGRVIPDVSALASGSWKIFERAASEVGGGTSAVAPLIASLIALANQKRATLGKKRLGYLNTRLYRLAAGGGLFHDITEGHNKPTPDYPGYGAKSGFDACTGWGVPICPELFEALVKLR